MRAASALVAAVCAGLLALDGVTAVRAQTANAKTAALRQQLEVRLDAIARDLDGVMGYVIVDLTTGERIERMANEVFPLASAVKLAVLYELFRQADEGALDLGQVRALDPRAAVGGTGILSHLSAPAMPLRDYAVLMIVLSDNTATNLLIDTVGMEKVTARMASLGLASLKLRRKMMDSAAAQRGDENVGSPADVARLLTVMHAGEGLRPTSAEAMLAILKKPARSALRRGVAPGTSVARKFGTLQGVETDAGIVYVPGRPYVLCVLTTFLKENAAGEAAIEAASRAAFDYFTRLARSSGYGPVIR